MIHWKKLKNINYRFYGCKNKSNNKKYKLMIKLNNQKYKWS